MIKSGSAIAMIMLKLTEAKRFGDRNTNQYRRYSRRIFKEWFRERKVKLDYCDLAIAQVLNVALGS